MLDIKKTLQDFAEITKGYNFTHARRDFQNLQSVTDFIYSQTENLATGETTFFLDPIIRKPSSDGVTYTGNFLILTNSNPDMTYNQKYEAYIEPMILMVQTELYNSLRCLYDINDLTVIEVIDMFDFNADGVSVSFSLKGYDRSFTIPEPVVATPAFSIENILFQVLGRGMAGVVFYALYPDETFPYFDVIIETADDADFTVNVVQLYSGAEDLIEFASGDESAYVRIKFTALDFDSGWLTAYGTSGNPSVLEVNIDSVVVAGGEVTVEFSALEGVVDHYIVEASTDGFWLYDNMTILSEAASSPFVFTQGTFDSFRVFAVLDNGQKTHFYPQFI